MRSIWMALCCALGLLLFTGMAHASFWQVVRDTPVREKPAAVAKVLDTARKGWIVNSMTQEDSKSQWIRVVELQTRLGDGMAYAHLLYKTPGEPVYLSAADVVQVADQNGAPLNKDNDAPAAAAATTRGARVELLSAPQAADLASNGAVDEAALKTALDTWVHNCNAVLGTYEGMDSSKATQEIIAWDHDTFADGLEEVEHSVMPILKRGEKAQQSLPPDVLGADDQKILAVLKGYGLFPMISGSSSCLAADLIALRKRVVLEPPADAYVALLDSQPHFLFCDGGCLYSAEEMGTWAVQWEQYLKTVPADSFYFSGGKRRYLEFATFILFSDWPITPAFPDSNNGKMTKDWMDELKSVASKNPGTQTAALITEFLKKVRDNGSKLAPADRKAFTAQLKAIPVSKPAAAASKLEKAEEKLLGRHMFSLQWIEGPMGKAVVSRTDNGGLRIDARQEHKGDFVTLNGDVRIIDDKNFVVTGTLVTRVSHIADGKACPRSGEYTFSVTKNRKYWRLQQMKNPCDSVVDYVDVYFKGL